MAVFILPNGVKNMLFIYTHDYTVKYFWSSDRNNNKLIIFKHGFCCICLYFIYLRCT